MSVSLVAFVIGYQIHITHNWTAAFSVGILFAVVGTLSSLLISDTQEEADAKASLDDDPEEAFL